MARTDKDAPAWVRARHTPTAEAWHHWTCEHALRSGLPASRRLPCDLDHPHNRGWRTNRCYYWAHDRTHRWTDGPNRERLHLGYFGPERAAVRDALHAAARDHNTHGETDIEPPTRQARRSPWLGGYWD